MNARLLAVGFAVSISLVPFSAQLALADDEPATQPADADAKNMDNVSKWLGQLASESFAEREEATKGLVETGEPAVEAIAETAEKSFDLEVPTRCVTILGRMLREGDEATRGASKAALERLAKSDRKFLARRAAETIAGPPEPAPAPGGGIVINGIRAAATAITQSTVNGVRTTDVKAEGKTIHVTDTNGRDITLKVTETAGGRQVVTEYTADDLADLRKKHPEAAALYEQYVEGGGNPFGVPGVGPGVRIAPNGRVRFPPGVPNRPRIRAPFVLREDVEQAIEQLEKSLAALEEVENQGKLDDGALDEVRRRIEEARRTLEEAP